MFLLKILLSLVAIDHPRSQEPQWRTFECSGLEVLPDGRVHVWPEDHSTIESQFAGSSRPDVVIDRNYPLLLDSRRIQWMYENKQILGRKQGATCATFNLPRFGRTSKGVEDRWNRVWFYDSHQLFCFDDGKWRIFDLPDFAFPVPFETSSLKHWPGQPLSGRSPKGDFVFFWAHSSLGFWVVHGENPVIKKVDATCGLPYWRVRHLVPLNEGRVLLFPGPIILQPSDWDSASALPHITGQVWADLRSESRERHREATLVLERLGRRSWLELRSAWDRDPWPLGMPYFNDVAENLGIGQAGDLPKLKELGDSASEFVWLKTSARLKSSLGEESISPDSSFVYRLNLSGELARAHPLLDAFDPDHVDAFGTAWKWSEGRLLLRLDESMRSILVDPVSERAISIADFFGVDRSERCYFRTSDGRKALYHVYSPRGTVTEDPPFIWKPLPLEIWQPEQEGQALDEVKKFILERNFKAAEEICLQFDNIAYKTPGRLRRPELWSRLRDGLRCRQGRTWADALPLPQDVAKIATMLELHSFAGMAYSEAVRAEAPSEPRVASWCAYLGLLSAVQVRDYRLALEFLDSMMTLGRSEQATELRPSIENISENVDSVEHQIEFARKFWGDRKSGFNDLPANRWLLETMDIYGSDMKDEEKKEIYALLQQFSEDLEEARSWSQRILSEFPEDRVFQASSLFRLAARSHEERQFVASLGLYTSIANHYPDTPNWHEAQFRAGKLLMRKKAYVLAIEALSKILTREIEASSSESSHEMEKRWPEREFASMEHDVVNLISECYESLGDYDSALYYLQLGHSSYPRAGVFACFSAVIEEQQAFELKALQLRASRKRK